MISWIVLGLFGGVVGLDSTSFPQVMISRPIVAATLTGAIFGRPAEGLAIGFVMEAFDLITLPIGAARYPESGTAAVAATGAYLAAMPPGLVAGPLVLTIVFGLAWEWLAGETVVLQRRNNGRILSRRGGIAASELERGHVTAMTMDFVRGAVVAGTGAVIGYAALLLLASGWGLPDAITLGALTLLVAVLVGTPLPLFGGGRARRLSWGAGLVVGVAVWGLL